MSAASILLPEEELLLWNGPKAILDAAEKRNPIGNQFLFALLRFFMLYVTLYNFEN
jgi:hypothetical protein